MKNILNVNKISLKSIFMSLAIVFAIGASFLHFFEKVVNASYSDDFIEKKVPNDDSVYPLDEILIANCREVTSKNIKVENSRSEYEVETEEEEEDMDDRSKFFVPEDNEYSDAQAKKTWKEFHNTLFGDSKSKINDLCPSIFKCSLT